MKKIFLFCSTLAIGIPLAIWIYHKIGLSGTFEELKILSWWQIILLFALGFLNLILWTCRWQLILKALKTKKVPFRALFGARSGELAISYLTPGIHYGGEVVRLVAMKKSGKVSLSDTATSIILDRIVEGLAFVLFLFVAATIFLFKANFTWALSLMITGFVLILFIFLILHFIGLDKLLNGFIKIFRLDKIKRFNRSNLPLSERMRRIGRQVDDFFLHSTQAVNLTVLISCLCFFIISLQLYLFVNFVDGPLSLADSLPMRMLINFSGFIPIPADIGIYEGASVLVFKLFGLQAATGLSYTLALRFVDFSLVAMGLIIIIRFFAEALFKFSNGIWGNNINEKNNENPRN